MTPKNSERKGRPPNASPYSRTGLFPWGKTYVVSVERREGTYRSRTPCHLRLVNLATGTPASRQTIYCPTCGRQWTVRIDQDGDALTATWTA